MDFISKLLNKIKSKDKVIEKIHPKFYKSDSGDIYLNFGEYGHEIEIACFSTDGNRVLCVKDVSQATIIDVKSGNQIGTIRPVSPLEGSKAGPTTDDFKVFIEAAALNYTGDLALLGLNDGTAGLFDVVTGERLSLFHHPDFEPASNWSLIKAVTFSPDYKMAFVGFYGRSVGIWDVETKELISILKSPCAEKYYKEYAWGRDTLVSSISVSSDNKYVFVGYSDMTAEIWDWVNKESVFNAFEHCEKIIALQQFENNLVWATSAGCIIIADKTNKEIKNQKCFSDSWSSVSLYNDMFLCLTQDFKVKSGNINGDYKLLNKLDAIVGCASYKKDIGFLKDRIYYFPLDKYTVKFELQGNEKYVNIDEDSAFPVSAIISSSKNYMVCYSDSKAYIYSLKSFNRESECSLKRRMYPLCITDNDQYLVIKNENYEQDKNSIYFWDIHKNELLYGLQNHKSILKFVKFSPLMKYFVSVDYEKIVLWKMSSKSNEAPCFLREINISNIDGAEFLDESRILLISRTSIELWNELREQVWSVKIPFKYERRFIINDNRELIQIEFPFNQIAEFNTNDGALTNVYGGVFPRPQYCGQGYRWEGPGGPYLHQGEGPRGWISQQNLSIDRKYVVLQASEEVFLASFDGEMKVIYKVPFKGRLRAGCILKDKILLISNEGRIQEIKYDSSYIQLKV